MKILLDECVPPPLKSKFVGFDVLTVPEAGWAGVKNGELLKLINESDFDVFITVDQNLQYQQNLENFQISIV